jgi:hypothetical protein
MDFSRVLDSVIGFLDREGAPYALIGGLGMAAYGMVRTTLDVDFVVPAEVQGGLVGFLECLGYDTLHQSTGYSNHLHPDPALGRVDVVYVRGETSRELFTARRWASGPGGRRLAVPRPEHLAAMKVFAMKNDPSRTFRELEDIRFLLTLDGVDREMVRGYFEKHGLGHRHDEILTTL